MPGSASLFQCSEFVILPSGEEALFSLWFGEVSASAPLSDGLAIMEAFHSTLSADSTFTLQYDEATIFSGYRVALVDIDTGATISAAVGGSPFAGSALTGVPLPPQLAVAITIRTALAGRSDRGRFYLPPVVTDDVGDTGRIGGTTPLTLVTAVGTAIDAAAAAGTAASLVVYSRKLHDTHFATRIECGDVFDTQRRRRDKLVETRQNYDLA
jgi:hypothetical protein